MKFIYDKLLPICFSVSLSSHVIHFLLNSKKVEPSLSSPLRSVYNSLAGDQLGEGIVQPQSDPIHEKFACYNQATPNETLVSRPPLLAKYMRAGGVVTLTPNVTVSSAVLKFQGIAISVCFQDSREGIGAEVGNEATTRGEQCKQHE